MGKSARAARLPAAPCSLGLELEKARQRAEVAVVAVESFHNDEPSLVEHVPLESLVLFRHSLANGHNEDQGVTLHIFSRERLDFELLSEEKLFKSRSIQKREHLEKM